VDVSVRWKGVEDAQDRKRARKSRERGDGGGRAWSSAGVSNLGGFERPESWKGSLGGSFDLCLGWSITRSCRL
jgi:hypothetical protein